MLWYPLRSMELIVIVLVSIQLCPWNLPNQYEGVSTLGGQYANPNFTWTDMLDIYNTPFPTLINNNQTGCCYNIWASANDMYMQWGICDSPVSFAQGLSNTSLPDNPTTCCIQNGDDACETESYTNYCNTDCCFIVSSCNEPSIDCNYTNDSFRPQCLGFTFTRKIPPWVFCFQYSSFTRFQTEISDKTNP